MQRLIYVDLINVCDLKIVIHVASLSNRHNQAMKREASEGRKGSRKLLIAPFRSTSKAAKLLVVTTFSTRMACQESVTIRAPASLEMSHCILRNPSCLFLCLERNAVVISYVGKDHGQWHRQAHDNVGEEQQNRLHPLPRSQRWASYTLHRHASIDFQGVLKVERRRGRDGS